MSLCALGRPHTVTAARDPARCPRFRSPSHRLKVALRGPGADHPYEIVSNETTRVSSAPVTLVQRGMRPADRTSIRWQRVAERSIPTLDTLVSQAGLKTRLYMTLRAE